MSHISCDLLKCAKLDSPMLMLRFITLIHFIHFSKGPGSLPPGLISRRGRFDDGASDISSVNSSNMDYSGNLCDI